jgi:hypothetical protein
MMKWVFDSHFGLRIKQCRAERNRKTSIVWQAFAGHQRHAVHFLGAQALYGVAVNLGNGGGHVTNLSLQPRY